MPNLRIAPRNFHDEATLTSADELTSLPATNTQQVRRGLVYRSSSATTPMVAIKGTLASARRVNCFAALRHNLYAASLQLQLYSDAAWTTQVYDSTALAAADLIAGAYDWGYTPAGTNSQFDPLVTEAPFRLFFAEQTVQSYQLTVSGTLGAAYAEIGRIFLGRYLELAINPSYGLGLGWQTSSQQVATRGGSLPTNDGARWRTLTFDLNAIGEAQRPTLLDIMAQCGLTRDMLVSVYPEDGTRRERDYTMNAKFTSLAPIARQPAFHTLKVAMREM